MLTKISIWDNEHGWKQTTAHATALLFPYTVPSSSEKFLCEVCGQYAEFRNGVYSPHFRHPTGSKGCEQKSTSYRYKYMTNPRGFSLPLKVKINNGLIEIFIGFLPIAESNLQILSNTRGQLTIEANNRDFRYNIDNSRFFSDRITYLSIGNNISEEYKLFYPDAIKKMNIFWPTFINGISRQGTLFDCESGKRLPCNANVIVGKDYLLFIRQWHQLTSISQPSEVIAIKEQTIGEYNIYRVRAKKISRAAADFFRRYDGCRLTDNPAILTLFYPFAVKNSHVITHTAEKVWFYKTNGFVEVYPQNVKPTTDIFAVNSGFQQILSLSRFENNTSVLRYTMLRKVQSIQSNTNRHANVDVHNNRNESIIPNEYTVLPPDREIHVIPEYDGYIEVSTGNVTINKIILKGGIKTIVNVEFNHQYRIFQGLDCIYVISYMRKKETQNFDDEEMLKKLQKFKGDITNISHSFGAVAYKLSNLPKTAIWLRKQIADGKIDRRAKHFLQNMRGK